MSTEIIEGGDKLIAKFMGYKLLSHKSLKYLYWEKPTMDEFGSIDTLCSEHDLKYHSSWDWLLPAWGKFVKLYHELGGIRHIYHKRKLRSEFAAAVDKCDINECFEILVEGVKWYQNQILNNTINHGC